MSDVGRENFEYVTLDTYAADMAELSSLAGNVATIQRRKIEEQERMILLLVRTCGGTVKIPYSVISAFSRSETTLTVEQMAHDRSVVVSTR